MSNFHHKKCATVKRVSAAKILKSNFLLKPDIKRAKGKGGPPVIIISLCSTDSSFICIIQCSELVPVQSDTPVFQVNTEGHVYTVVTLL